MTIIILGCGHAVHGDSLVFSHTLGEPGSRALCPAGCGFQSWIAEPDGLPDLVGETDVLDVSYDELLRAWWGDMGEPSTGG